MLTSAHDPFKGRNISLVHLKHQLWRRTVCKQQKYINMYMHTYYTCINIQYNIYIYIYVRISKNQNRAHATQPQSDLRTWRPAQTGQSGAGQAIVKKPHFFFLLHSVLQLEHVCVCVCARATATPECVPCYKSHTLGLKSSVSHCFI